MVLAEGGTAGPPTGHMIVAARSKTIEGPWENSPYNPIVRTQSNDERWWSKGHGTLVEDRAGKWWMVYHAYENGFYTLGRQTLLEPIEWTSRRLVPIGGRRSGRADREAGGGAGCRMALRSPTISRSRRMGVQWSFYTGDEADRERYRYENGALVLKAQGHRPGRQLAAVVRQRRSRLRDGGRDRRRSRRERGPAAVLQPPALRRPRLLGAEPASCTATAWIARRRKPAHLGQHVWHPPAQRSAHRHDRLQRRRQDVGALRSRRWRCRAITTTSPTISSTASRRSRGCPSARSAARRARRSSRA